MTGHYRSYVPSYTPEEIRTPDLLVRSQTLYPAELRAHILLNCLVITTPLGNLFGLLFNNPTRFLDSTSQTAFASACLTARRRAAELRAHILFNCRNNDSATCTQLLTPNHNIQNIISFQVIFLF